MDFRLDFKETTQTEKIAIMDKYRGEKMIPSVRDCTTLLLEIIGYQRMEEIKGKYDSVMRGAIFLRKYSGLSDMGEYAEFVGYEKQKEGVINDFDLVVHGLHCGVVFGEYLFGVDPTDGVFKYRKVDFTELQEEIYTICQV